MTRYITPFTTLCAALLLPYTLVGWQQSRVAVILTQAIPSPDQIANLEQAVAHSPDNLTVRTQMLQAYAAAAPLARDDYRAARLRHIQFVIESNPSSDLAAAPLAWVGSSGATYANPTDHGNMRALWLSEASQHFDDTPVGLNAIRFLAPEDKKQAEELFKRMMAARPAEVQIASYLGFFYASGLVRADTLDGRVISVLSDAERDDWNAWCRRQLNESMNAHVLVGAATALPNMAMRRIGGGPEYEALVRYAGELNARAARMGNAAGVPKKMPVEMQMFADETKRGAEPTGLQAVGVPFTANQINVAPKVQSARVMLAPPPNYPAIAMQGRVQGTVRMQVVIGQDGLVNNVQLLSGHPLLAQAAVDAVKAWSYQPTMQNGVPVSVVTTVDVPFTLPPL